MANLPAVRELDTTISSTQDAWRDQIADLIASGLHPNEIAKRIYPEDRKKRKALRNRARQMVYTDAEFQSRIALRARGQMIMDLVPAVAALGGRAKRTGRMPEIKLMMEATGFHNPRVAHEHSGDIKITVNMPRPVRTEDEDVVDAEVVD